MKFDWFVIEEKILGGRKKVYCCKCNTEHGMVILKAPTLEELQKSFEFYNKERV